ncbi:thioredoxin [Acaryochloris marina]|uniref:Thioredoxin n=1 Tax=Acaryochloris marina (strain MBIC 11017) TaxID=329726 RepID=B0CCV7_ACAM1|nr:thioredoxin [Acaryochloris marina]ABW30399.1 thioredoxin [Acaryochloris marina MBIC11017]
MSTVAYIQDNEFEQLLKDESILVIDFTATWCGPCKQVSPMMDKLATDYDGRAKVTKVDVDKNKGIAKQFGIRSIPAVLVFKSGELVETLVGMSPYEKFTSAVDKHL